MSEPVIVACGFAHEPRHLTGQVWRCVDCTRKIYLTDDAREHVERMTGSWSAVCIPCARKRVENDPVPSVEVTPLARALANVHRRQN